MKYNNIPERKGTIKNNEGWFGGRNKFEEAKMR